MKFRIKGVYEMTFFVDVDRLVDAENEEEAMDLVQDQIGACEAYDQNCLWADSGPTITEEST